MFNYKLQVFLMVIFISCVCKGEDAEITPVDDNNAESSPANPSSDPESENGADNSEDGSTCSEDFLENLQILRVLDGHTHGPENINRSELSNETVLQAVGGELRELCQGHLSDLKKLSFFDLSSVQLEEIQNGVFEETTELKEVVLKNNRLTEIKAGIFAGTNLVVINLENNQISKIDEDAFDDMPYLMSVDLDSNDLTQLNPNWFQNTPNMRYITFNFNSIQELPANAFQYMVEYEGVSIYLIYNEIQTIDPQALSNFKEHGRFVLDHNRIEKLPLGLLPHTNHTFSLSLYGNRLSCLADKILHNIASSCKELDLGNNPFEEKCLEEIKTYRDEYKQSMNITLVRTKD